MKRNRSNIPHKCGVVNEIVRSLKSVPFSFMRIRAAQADGYRDSSLQSLQLPNFPASSALSAGVPPQDE